MEYDNEHDLEDALRESRIEPDDRFVGTLTDEIGTATRSRRARRSRLVGVGVALVLTLVLVSAIGASMGSKPLKYAPSSVVGVVSDVVSADTANTTNNTPADDEYKQKCNSGRGNLSETDSGTHQTDSSTLINPHDGGTGPGDQPTDDCDPGNSGPHNSGGD